MNIVRNIPFLIWFSRFLRTIRPNKLEIKRYRDEGDDEKERKEIIKVENLWGEAQVKRVGITLNVSRSEPLPEGPVVFVSNHQSYWDIPIYFAAIKEKQYGFVAKESLGKIPFFGSWIADIRSVFIKRDDVRASLKAIEEGVELLKRGYSLVIFPEGTRSKGSEMAEFKKGSLRLAVKAGVPIVPITLNGTYRAFEEKGYVRPATIDFIVHPAINTKGLSRSELSNMAERVEEIIRNALPQS